MDVSPYHGLHLISFESKMFSIIEISNIDHLQKN